MKRLTRIDEDGDVAYNHDADGNGLVFDSMILTSLSEYESTNLTPAEIVTLLSEVERLQQAQRWTPVTERLPNRQQSVLVRLSAGGTQVGWIMWDIWAWNGYKYTDAVVTHWMPLPEPPKEG